MLRLCAAVVADAGLAVGLIFATIIIAVAGLFAPGGGKVRAGANPVY